MSSSPQRPKRLSTASTSPSPVRRPLAERSHSNTNGQSHLPPTIRIVPDTGPASYTKSPFPSDPAHHLPPRGGNIFLLGQTSAGSALRAANPSISDENASVLLKGPQHETQQPLHPRPAAHHRHRMSTDTTSSSDAETLATNYAPSSFSPSLSSRFSYPNTIHTANTTSPSTPTLGTSSLLEDAYDALPLPSFPKDQGQNRASTASQSTIRLVTPERQTGANQTPGRLPSSRETTFGESGNFTVYSTDSTDTITHTTSGLVAQRRLQFEEASPPSSPNFEIFASSTSSAYSHAHSHPHPQARDTEERQQRHPAENLGSAAPSSDSVAYSVISVTRPRSASSPPGTSSHGSLGFESVDRIQYPKVRQASAGSWAEVSIVAPEEHGDEFDGGESRPVSEPLSELVSESEPASEIQSQAQDDTRMSGSSSSNGNNESAHRLSTWSSRLSTIPSESEPRSGRGEDAAYEDDDVVSALSSEPHAGASNGAGEREPRLRRVYGSISSIGTGVSSPSDSAVPFPQPLFAARDLPQAPAPLAGSEYELHGGEPGGARRSAGDDEGDDTLGELAGPHTLSLRPQRSGYLSKLKGKNASSESLKSSLSFVGELSWVRNFYRSGEWPKQFDGASPYSTPAPSTSRLNTATSRDSAAPTTSPMSDAFPSEIHRPRNRPRLFGRARRARAGANASAGTVSEANDDERDGDEGAPGTGQGVHSPSVVGSGVFSPHLRRGRREAGAPQAWTSPSMESFFGRSFFGPLNRQVWLFCLGFVFPLTWFVAAFLPIPHKPVPLYDPEAEGGQGGLSGRFRPSELAEMEREEKVWLKMHWWRTLNRVMCVAGVAVIAAVVTLVVLALRMH